MARNKILPYNHKLKEKAKELRKKSTLSEVILWKYIKGRSLGCQFHRQVPIHEYIVDFYCHELKLAIEIDGSSHIGNELKDLIRQQKLESFGVVFIRFDDAEIKHDIFHVLLTLSCKIDELTSFTPL